MRLQERVLELEAELGQRSWKVGDFYRVPTASGAVSYTHLTLPTIYSV